MAEQLLRTECCGCYACYNVCPVKCILMKKNEEGFYYPYVEKDKCIQCKQCESACPMEIQVENGFQKQVFAAYSVDENKRMNSSSGGIFPVLAEFVLQQKGIVFGATFNSKFEVEHRGIDDKKELILMQGTKYVQSQIKKSFLSAKSNLDKGKLVLFTGSPCQIAGLKKFLGKDYDNLITQDIICHGVPAPGVWQEFLECRRKDKASEIKDILFRDKEESWEEYSLKIDYENGETYRKKRREDSYLLGFLDDIYLRKSCYNCKFKGGSRLSDFTLGDFWGIEKVFPDMHDDKGTSVLVVNTTKGAEILNEIQDRLYLKKSDLNTIEIYNPSYNTSVTEPIGREKFYKHYGKRSFDKGIKKVMQQPFLKRCKSVIYSMLQSIGLK